MGSFADPIVNFFAAYINHIIVALFIINILIFVIIRLKITGIKQYLDETRTPESGRVDPARRGASYLERLLANYDEWGRRYRNINPWVHYYEILTSLFPLMGILGTVCGLLQITSNFTQLKAGFLIALSSTFWGLIAAIVSKAGEGFFAADIDRFKVIYEIFTKDIINIEKMDMNHAESNNDRPGGLMEIWERNPRQPEQGHEA